MTVGADRPLIDAAGKLGTGTDMLVVLGDSGLLVGLLTKTDVVRQMCGGEGPGGARLVSGVMTRDVVTCQGADRLQDVADRMKRLQLKNMPVVDSDGSLTATYVKAY